MPELETLTPLQLRAELERLALNDLLGPADGPNEIAQERNVPESYTLSELARLLKVNHERWEEEQKEQEGEEGNREEGEGEEKGKTGGAEAVLILGVGRRKLMSLVPVHKVGSENTNHRARQ
jgi:hypothetical protein